MTSTVSALPEKFISPEDLVHDIDRTSVLVAFSGGADSRALLHMMCCYAKQCGIKVFAAHVNHMIRGAEADRDEQFCRDVAKEYGIELFVCRKDVPEYARLYGMSVEEAARQLRYDFFDEIMGRENIPLLATAHNADDNLETVLFNIARGCALDGVCGIPRTRSCQHGTVIRPILQMNKDEILDYCRKHTLSFVTDSTNTDTEYTRNKIRSHVIPVLKSINGSAVENATKMTLTLREDAACLEAMTNWFLSDVDDELSIEAEKIVTSPASVSSRAIIAIYKEISGGKALEHVHVNAIRELCAKAVPHSRISLPNGAVAQIEDGRLYIREQYTIPEKATFEAPLCEGVNTISEIRSQIIIGNSQNAINIYKKSTSLYIHSDKIKGKLVARSRRAGDRIRINSVNKSVKKLLCDLKIPLELRYRLPLICDEDGIVAIPFAAVRDGARADEHTADLCIKFCIL